MEKERFKAFLLSHIERRPEIETRDVYKLLYQAVFGVGHIMGANASDRLREEASSINLRDHPEEPVVEPVSKDGAMIRVNLRPYLRGGGSLEGLYEAMKESSVYKGAPEEFGEYWKWFKELVSEKGLSFDQGTIVEYDEDLKTNGPKPRHHTERYREAYYPAYRVVRRDAYEKHSLVSSATD